MSAILENTISRYVARGVAVPGFLLTAKSGKRYFITADSGNIVRLDMAFEPSGQWRAVAVYTSRGAYLSDWSTSITDRIAFKATAWRAFGARRFPAMPTTFGARTARDVSTRGRVRPLTKRHSAASFGEKPCC